MPSAAGRRGLACVDVRLVFSVPIPRGRSGDPLPRRHPPRPRRARLEGLGLPSSPSAVLLGVDGLVAGGPVSGMDELGTFVDDIEEALRERTVAVEETRAPTRLEEPRLTSDR